MTGGRRGQHWMWVEIVAVATLALIAVALRVYRLDLGWFGVDQARDIATALDVIAGRDLPSIGPTMRRVTRLGALYYYFWTVPYLLWRDPLAGYWFASLLSSSAVLLTWALARRLWGPLAALVTLAIAASHPVWVLDGRIAWAPAALPAAAIVLLWLVAGRCGRDAPLSGVRAALFGALLGLAVQLHLAMVPWVAAAFVVLLLDRTPARAWLACAAAFALVASPAAWALVARPATEGGVAALAVEQQSGGAIHRIVAIAALPIRVPAAFARWSDVDPSGGAVAVAASMVVAAAVLLGLVALVILGRSGERAARLAVLAALATLGLVVMIPGSPWYYYLDALLPVWALGAGALVTGAAAAARGRGSDAAAAAPARSAGARQPIDARERTTVRARAIVATVLVIAAVVVAARMRAWLADAARYEYLVVDPALLTLASRPGRDAAAPGRLVSLGVKRALAERIATAWSRFPSVDAAESSPVEDGEADFAALWHRLHGPAWEDATGDNGFWLRLAHRARPRPAETSRQLAIWYRDDPVVDALEQLPKSNAVTLTRVGPLVLAEYASTIDYASCASDGSPIVVPMRAVPQPKRYGDGTPEKPRELPSRLTCGLAPERGVTRVVAALSGPGRVDVVVEGQGAGAGPVTAACIPPPARVFQLWLDVPPAGATALDLYDVPAAAGCEP